MASRMIAPTKTRPFFRFMAERHAIWERRAASQPWPWTKDKILQTYKFTNVFRELDKTTVWFRDNVRTRYSLDPRMAVIATVIFRWFNRITTGERLLEADLFEHWTPGRARKALKDLKPLVTGAYMIRSPDGKDKLTGMIEIVTNTVRQIESVRPWDFPDLAIEMLTRWLAARPFLGPFLAYEVTTDLRHTGVLCDAPDILTWANAGPGAMRGVNRLLGFPAKPKRRFRPDRYLEEMRGLLASVTYAKAKGWLPVGFPTLELREIEHTLCEFDKYERARLGEGRPRSIYRRDAE